MDCLHLLGFIHLFTFHDNIFVYYFPVTGPAHCCKTFSGIRPLQCTIQTRRPPVCCFFIWNVIFFGFFNF